MRDYLGAGYGAVTDAGLAAQRLLLDEEGIALETTYTAKCMAALLDLAARPPYRGQTAAVLEHLQLGRSRRAMLGPLPDWRALPPPFHRFF